MSPRAKAQVAEDAEELAAIRQADGLAPDGTGPGLPLGPGGARPW